MLLRFIFVHILSYPIHISPCHVWLALKAIYMIEWYKVWCVWSIFVGKSTSWLVPWVVPIPVFYSYSTTHIYISKSFMISDKGRLMKDWFLWLGPKWSPTTLEGWDIRSSFRCSTPTSNVDGPRYFCMEVHACAPSCHHPGWSPPFSRVPIIRHTSWGVPQCTFWGWNDILFEEEYCSPPYGGASLCDSGVPTCTA